jgi:hypothetical protein
MRSIVFTVNDTDLVWVWVANAVCTLTFHDSTIESEELWELTHVVVAALVQSAELSSAFTFFMSIDINARVL